MHIYTVRIWGCLANTLEQPFHVYLLPDGGSILEYILQMSGFVHYSDNGTNIKTIGRTFPYMLKLPKSKSLNPTSSSIVSSPGRLSNNIDGL